MVEAMIHHTAVEDTVATVHVDGAAFMPIGQPLDLQATLESGQAFRWRRDQGWYWGVIGRHSYALYQVEGGLLFRTSAPSTAEALAELHALLRLDDDLEAICRDMAADKPLSEAVARHRGLRLLRQDPWECLASFICSSASNIPRISRNVNSVAEAYGEPVSLEGRRLWRFPGAERVAEAGEKALLGLGLGFRAGYLANTATRVAEGRVDLMALRLAPYSEAKAVLMELPGVGDKVADCVLVFSLDKLEGFPIDRWVRRALEEWYGHREKAQYRELLEWAQERWGQRAGYAQQYLFHHLRLLSKGS
ncbi:MAG: DNA glycosylase [Dehalococcoidia bacterium]|nr:DNA glycosylase [Dehalococcoidia bacterium]